VKVLILHQHFNTPDRGGPLRSYYLAKALRERQVNVSVITARQQALYSNEQIEGIDVHYLPIAYDNKFGFYKRGISFLSYAVQAVRVAGRLGKIDFCYAMSVPLTVGQAAIWMERKFQIPFIFEVGDLWPDAPIQLGFIRNSVLQRSLYWMEKRIYQKARSIVALSEPIRQAIDKKVPSKTITVIPNISDTDFYRPALKDPAVENQFGVAGKFVVAYIGAVGFANGLDYFLECARASAKSAINIHFLLCGEGAAYDGLVKACKNYSLDNFTMVPFKNKDGVREILGITDAAFISYRPFPILETGSPNKYFDGLAAGKLIITNFGGWIADEIRNERCGISLSRNAPQKFPEEINEFLQNVNLLNEYKQNARRLAERKYSRDILGERFIRLFV
jgi:glycosyltransferase involved in cell wall biosynthesis